VQDGPHNTYPITISIFTLLGELSSHFLVGFTFGGG
jgi:hypothetical protein